MKRDILYYPTIEFRGNDYYWLWVSSLLWDRIYRIVPDGYVLNEPRNIAELCSTGEIGIPLSPNRYSKQASDKFLENIESRKWRAAALEFHHDDIEEYEKYTRLHRGKIDVALKNLILLDDEQDNDWLYVPRDMANNYMTYLANDIATKNNLSLSTASQELWTAATFFQYDGVIQEGLFIGDDYDESSSQILASIYLNDITPENIMSISPKDLLNFREKRKDERTQFINSVEAFQNKISNVNDPKILHELIDDEIKSVEIAKNEYKRSMDILRVTKWIGGISSLVTVAVDAAGYFEPSATILKPLTSTGIGIGIVTGLLDKKFPVKETPYSYLHNMNSLTTSSFSNYNYKLYRNIEEFIND